MRRLAVIVCALLLAISGASAQYGGIAVDSTQRPPAEEGIISFEIPGVLNQEMFVRMAGDSVLLPFVELCNILSVRYHVSARGDTLSAEIPAGQPFHLFPREGRATFRGKELQFSPWAVEIVDGLPFVERNLLGACIGIPLDYDQTMLAVSMQASLKIPVVARFQNKRRYEALAQQRNMTRGDAPAADVQRQLLGNLAIDWSATEAYQDEFGHTAAGFYRVGGPFLFGVADVSGSATYSPRDGEKPTIGISNWSWRFALPNWSLLKLIEIGSSLGMERPSYSLALSNVPLAPRRTYDVDEISGRTEPGWTVELYDRGVLVDVAQADAQGYYSFPMSIGYYPMTLEVHALGPHGEVEIDRRRIEVGREFIPAGVVEYEARFRAQGTDMQAPLDGMATLRMGLTPWLTLGGTGRLSSSTIRGVRPDQIQPTAFMYLWPGASSRIGVNYDVRAGAFGGDLELVTPDEIGLHLRLESLVPAARAISASGLANIPLGGSMFTLNSHFRSDSGAWMVDAVPQFSTYVAGFNINMTSMLAWRSPDHMLPGETSSENAPNGPVTSQLWIQTNLFQGFSLGARGTYIHASNLPSRIDLTSSMAITSWLRAGAVYTIDSLQWKRGSGRFDLSTSLFNRSLFFSVVYTAPGMNWKEGQLQATLRADLGFGQFRNQTSYQGKDMTTISYMDGGLLLSESGIRGTNEGAVGATSIIVRAFNDVNANGYRDDEEEWLPGMKVLLGHSNMESPSEDGEFYGLTPDEIYNIGIDPWNFADRGIFPRRTRYIIYGAASTVHTVEVPFAPGFDVNGSCRLELADGKMASSSYSSVFNGLRPRLRSLDGSAEYEGEIFSDGSVTFIGVSRGTYQILFNNEELADRGVRLRTLPAYIDLNENGSQLPDIIFEIHTQDAGSGE